MSALQEFFENLLVVETATILAGPAVGMFLAELGATVVKVENLKSGGDTTRLWKLKSEDPETDISAYFTSVNWGKKSIALNLRDDAERQILFALLDQADIFLQNFRPDVQARLGLTYPELSRRNPGLISAQVIAYAEGDNRPGFDAVMQAETGFMELNGEPDGSPTKMPVALVDVLSAHQLKEAVLLALMERNLTGKGCELTASLFQSGIASLINQATNYLVANVVPTRRGSDHPNVAPYGSVYQTADDHVIMLAVGTDQQFVQLCKVLGCDSLATDERFVTNVQRVTNNELLKELLAPRIKTFNRDELLEKLNEMSVPAGAVRPMDDVFAQPAAQDMLHHGQLDDGRTIRGVRAISFGRPPGLSLRSLSPPPRLDTDRAEILKMIGVSTSEDASIR
ncbi:CoA transferase [Chloroflexi bacterium TSY]|nr:CoA transferase [Chloroflexi bacterium TSY]